MDGSDDHDDDNDDSERPFVCARVIMNHKDVRRAKQGKMGVRLGRG